MDPESEYAKGRFRCHLYYGTYQVLEANIPNQGYREEESIKALMRIKLLHTFKDKDFNSEILKNLGIKTVRGPRHMTDELVQAMSPYLKGK